MNQYNGTYLYSSGFGGTRLAYKVFSKVSTDSPYIEEKALCDEEMGNKIGHGSEEPKIKACEEKNESGKEPIDRLLSRNESSYEGVSHKECQDNENIKPTQNKHGEGISGLHSLSNNVAGLESKNKQSDSEDESEENESESEGEIGDGEKEGVEGVGGKKRELEGSGKGDKEKKGGGEAGNEDGEEEEGIGEEDRGSLVEEEGEIEGDGEGQEKNRNNPSASKICDLEKSLSHPILIEYTDLLKLQQEAQFTQSERAKQEPPKKKKKTHKFSVIY